MSWSRSLALHGGLAAIAALGVVVVGCRRHAPAVPDVSAASHHDVKAAPARSPAAASSAVAATSAASGDGSIPSRRLSPACRAALERGVARARAAWRSRAKAHGFTAKTLDSGETECSRRLHVVPALYQMVQATLDADQCVPQVVVRIEAAPDRTSTPWRTVQPGPSWYGQLFRATMPVVAPPLVRRTDKGLAAYVLAQKQDLPALQKAVDACMR